MKDLFFASNNPDKFDEVVRILHQWNLTAVFVRLELTEIQADDLEPIAAAKAETASERLAAAAFVEDAGLFIESLQGFPGPYSSYVFRTVGVGGILRLLGGERDRRACFRSVIAYCQPQGRPECFTASVPGVITLHPRGGGWGYDPIFVPDGFGGRTYGELQAEKNAVSHRRKSLELFARRLLRSA